MPGDTEPKTSRLRPILERLIFIGGMILVAVFLEAPRLLVWVGPIATFAILTLLLVPAAVFMLTSKHGTLQYRSSQASISFAAGLLLVYLFFWLAPSSEPIALAILLVSVLIPGIVLALAGAIVRPFLMAEGIGTWLYRHGQQIVPHLTHKNFHLVMYLGYVVAGAGAYAIGPPLPAGVSPFIPWVILVVGLNIVIVALTLDHELVPKGAK